MKIRYSVVLKNTVRLEQMDLTQARMLQQKRTPKGTWEAEFNRFLDKSRFGYPALERKAQVIS